MGRWWPSLVVAGVFTVAGGGVLLSGAAGGRAWFDGLNYHLPAIIKFAEEWPRPDVSNYLSATTPGYHLLLAVVARFVSDETAPLRAVGGLFTLGLLALYARAVSGRLGGVAGVLFGLTLGASVYVFSAGVFLLPDNAAWLGVLALMVLALRPRVDAAFYVASAAVFVALVATRQSHAWAAALVWGAAWLGGGTGAGVGGGLMRDMAGLVSGEPLTARARRLGLGVAATLPGLVLLGWFGWMWGGLTVPIYHGYMQGVNPVTPAVIVLQLGAFGVFMAPWWWGGLVGLVRGRPWAVAVIVAVGLAVACSVPTTYDQGAGRWSGVWNVVRAVPVIGGRTSPVFLVGVPVGAAVVAGVVGRAPWRARWVLLGGLGAFMAAMSANRNAWPRYHEPFVLMWLGLGIAAGGVGVDRPRAGVVPAWGVRAWGLRGVWRWAGYVGPGVLVVLLAGVTARQIGWSRPVRLAESQGSGEGRLDLRSLWPRSWREGGPPGELAPIGGVREEGPSGEPIPGQ